MHIAVSKLRFLILIISLHQSRVLAQPGADITAIYDVEHSINFKGINENYHFKVKYEGYIYYSPQQGKIISFLKPSFWGEYPAGYISFLSEDKTTRKINLNTDSMQYLFLYDSIKSKQYYYIYEPRGHTSSSVAPLKKNIHRWEIFKETKTIAGLLCRRAFVYAGSNEAPFWEVWVTDELNIPQGFLGLSDIPGLVVQAENYTSGFKFSLREINTEPINSIIFWPEFLQKAVPDK